MSSVVVRLGSGKFFKSEAEETILESAIRAGCPIEHSCKKGQCGVCESTIVDSTDESLIGSRILTCEYRAVCDIEIDAEYFEELGAVKTLISPAKVNKILYQSEEIMNIELRLPPTKLFNFLPGQYIDLKYDGVTRSYSIASEPNSLNTIELNFKKVKDGQMSSRVFKSICLEQLVQIEGPKGTFFLRNKRKGPLIFLATGTGFAPVKSMVESIISSGNVDRPIHIYWGNRFKKHYYSLELIDKWCEDNSNIQVNYCLSRRDVSWSAREGYVQDCLIEDLLDLKEAEVYACGSMSMIKSSKSLLASNGFDLKYFYSDAFVAS